MILTDSRLSDVCIPTFEKKRKTFWQASIDAAHFVIASLALLSFSVLFLDSCQIEECQNYMVQ